METIKFKTSYESLITRIPGLFAYVENDDKGNSILHKATDSPMGCYGKIVENIKYDKSDNLCLNVDVDYEIIDNKVTINGIEYEVKDNKFIVNDKVYEVVDNKVTINDVEYEVKDDRIVKETKILVESGKTYSFKTLITLYYKYLNDSTDTVGFKDFKEFIENGIGKISVVFKGLDRNENDLVPDFIYLSTVRTLYDEMKQLSLKCNFYDAHKKNKDKSIDNESEVDLCCQCVLYKRKGGDGMLNFLKDQLEKVEKRSDDWFKKADRVNPLRINYSVKLTATERDMGIVTPLNDAPVNTEKLDPIEINFTTNSKLKSLRRYKTYMNQYDEEERPGMYKDWLFYYRIGQVCNLSVLNDDYGNILTTDTNINNINVTDVVEDLMAYGDVIENITLNFDTYDIKGKGEEKAVVIKDIEYIFNNSDIIDNKIIIDDKEYIVDDKNNQLKIKNGSITITYWTDVHLKATCTNVNFDDDGNKKVSYDKFEIDKNQNPEDKDENQHGIKYVETYEFDDSSELNGITENEFKEYVNGNNDGEDVNYEYKPYEKYEFSTYNATRLQNKQINYYTTQYSNIIADNTSIKVSREKENDKNGDLGLIHIDFYDGVSYFPTEKFDVAVDRGTTSIFDKHIRFSEVKTLQDMEEFSNGSFFKMQE